jgi:hypothetical protein
MAWEVVGAGTGAKITVTWDCYLKMLDRRVLGGPLQKRQAARVGSRRAAGHSRVTGGQG